MSEYQTILDVMHADPETLPGVPTNEEIIAGSDDLKRWGPDHFSDEVRKGFLQMWQMGYAREQIESLDKVGLLNLAVCTTWDLYNDSSAQRRQELRFIHTITRNTLAIRQAKEPTQ